MNVVLLAGGVGGAKLAFGLSRLLAPEELSVVVNVGDDFTHMGLRICPDLDTVTYTLAGLDNRDTGWGLAADTFNTLDALITLDGPDWFRLGDQDLATHLMRTHLLSEGRRLTEVTQHLGHFLGVSPTVLPATDDAVPTRVITDEGDLAFQDYFVRHRCEPRVSRLVFQGIEAAAATPEVTAALEHADVVVIAPSNPFVSIEPILALPGVRERVAMRPTVAISPIVGGRAIKGPAAKMLQELGIDVSAKGVAARYAGVIGGFLLDTIDADQAPAVHALGMAVLAAPSVMQNDTDRQELARRSLELALAVSPAGA